MGKDRQSYEGCDLTTDLYLEMLRGAQRVEDKKLVQLICRRISERHPLQAHVPTGLGAEIIPFPGSHLSGSPAAVAGFLDDVQKDVPFNIAYWPLIHMGLILFAGFMAMVKLVAS